MCSVRTFYGVRGLCGWSHIINIQSGLPDECSHKYSLKSYLYIGTTQWTLVRWNNRGSFSVNREDLTCSQSVALIREKHAPSLFSIMPRAKALYFHSGTLAWPLSWAMGIWRVIHDWCFFDFRRFSLIFWCEGVLTIIIGSLGVIGHIFSIGILTSRWAQKRIGIPLTDDQLVTKYWHMIWI